MQMPEKQMSTTRKCVLGSLILTSALLYAVLEWSQVFKIVVRIPIVGWLVEYNLPPSDFYVPLDSTPLLTGSVDLKFTCKYRGRHEVQIYGIQADWNKAVSFWDSNVGMNVVVRDCDGRVLYKSEEMNARISGGNNGMYNYCYAIFNAPDDVPLGTKLTAEITCYGDVKDLLNHFPGAEIVVKKVFDK